METRRKFITKATIAGLAIPFFGNSFWACVSKADKKSSVKTPRKLNILILGGTSFLGPHQVAYALSRGHTVSIFTRGRTKPTVHSNLFKDVEHLVGDRSNDLKALENRNWDVVIDNSGRNASWTERSANLLKDNVDLYVYTSSTGVYYPYLGSDIDESTKLLLEEPESVEDENMKIEYWYGVMKSNSEIKAKKAFGEERTIVVRPTYMIGPGDKSDRFMYWPIRLSRGGEVLVPGKENDPVQYIDVRDVAEWMIRLVEDKLVGTFNAVGPKSFQTMYNFIQEAKSAFDTNLITIQVNDYEFLKDNGILDVVPWIMPTGNNYGSARISNAKGIEFGLTYRNLNKTVIDSYNWWYSDALTKERRDKFELNPDKLLIKEPAIIQAWKQR